MKKRAIMVSKKFIKSGFYSDGLYINKWQRQKKPSTKLHINKHWQISLKSNKENVLFLDEINAHYERTRRLHRESLRVGCRLRAASKY